jgi:PAS domain S-box-containing protein
MTRNQTYEGLQQKVKELEKQVFDHKQVQDELQKSEKKYRLISESTSDLIAITTFNLKPKYTYVSPSHKLIMGYEPEELIGKSGLKYIHPTDRKKLLPLLEKYIRSKTKKRFAGNDLNISETIDFRAKVKTGNWCYLQSTVNIIGNELLFISKDITEQKRAEEKLKNSEERYKILCENAPIGIYYSDFYGKFLYGNKKAEKIISHKRDELIGKSFLKLKLLNPKYLGKAVKLLALNKLGKSTGPDDFTLIKKNGSKVTVEINTEVITIKGKKAVLGMVQDITDRKKTEDSLRENEQRYALATAAAKVGVWDWNTQTQEFYLDPNVKAILGYSDEEIPNDLDVWSTYVHPDDNQPVMEAFQAHMEGKTPEFVFEHRMLHKDGSIRWIMARGTAIRDAQGNVMRVMGTDTDITKRKQAEVALQEAHDELEQRVAERTVELSKTNQQLMQEIQEHKRTEKALKQKIAELNSFLNNLPDMAWLKDTKSCFIAVNNTFSKAVGMEPNSLINQTCEVCFGTKEVKKFRKDDLIVMKSKRQVIIEEEILDLQKNKIWLETIKSPIINDTGKVIGTVGVSRDISLRKKTEEALRESEEKYRTLFDSAADLIGVVDTKGNVLELNRMFEKESNYKRKEMIGKNIFKSRLVTEASAAKMLHYMKKMLMGRKWPILEVDGIRKDGAIIPFELRAVPIKKGDQIVAVQAILRNISERKKAEIALKKRTKELKYKTQSLEEVNTALNVLLEKRDADKSELEEKIVVNIKELIMPYLEKLKKSQINTLQKSYLDVLESNLIEITSPFYHTLSSSYSNLTPKEMQVADLVKQGKTSKEIAELLYSSKRAIEFHRNNLRNKLGLSNKKTNLRSHLLSLP